MKHLRFNIGLGVGLFLFLFSLNGFAGEQIRVMAYNVENLFDTEHDPGKNDWYFLPKFYRGKNEACQAKDVNRQLRCLASDWTDSKLKIKLKNIRKIVTHQGGLPDILALEEVENRNVLRQLARVLGYRYYILEEGPDRRGIDVALLYKTDKLRYLDHKTWEMRGPEFNDKPTRPILGVYFEVNGTTLAVYVNHWPSQAAPASKRVLVAKELMRFLAYDERRFKREFAAIAVGDFNTVVDDHPHPFKSVILDDKWGGQKWFDSRIIAKESGKSRDAFRLGSYFYKRKMRWQFLDRIFVTKNLIDRHGIDLNPASFRITSPKWATITYEYEDIMAQTTTFGSRINGVPFRYDFGATNARDAGYSDHFAVSISLFQ